MSESLINVVLDLETLGTSEDSAIIQIGCMIPVFDFKHIPQVIPAYFEATVRYEECLERVKEGFFTMEDATMEWWSEQPTRKIVFSGQDTYADVFESFNAWIESLGKPVAIWGNGSDFDNRLLSYSLGALNAKVPWDFRSNRDLRTLRALFPIEKKDEDISSMGWKKHTALGDAGYEAAIVHKIWTQYPYLQGVL